MENNNSTGGVQSVHNPKRKPLSDISNGGFGSSLFRPKPKADTKPVGPETRIANREFASCSVDDCTKSKSKPNLKPNQNADKYASKPNPSNNNNNINISDSNLASCSTPAPNNPKSILSTKSKSKPNLDPNQNADKSGSEQISSNNNNISDSNLASCSTPAPINPKSILNLGDKSTEIKHLTTYKSRKSCTNQLEINTKRRETGTSETEILSKSRNTGTSETEILSKSGKTGTSETEILSKSRKTGTSETEILTKSRNTGTSELAIETTKKRKTGTNEPHLTGVSSCPPIQKNVQKKGEKSTKREKRPVVSSVPAKKRKNTLRWPEDFLEKQRAYFAEIDAEELLEETDSD